MTLLPPDAPAPYARSQLGPRAIAWCAKRWPSFADRRRVVTREPVSPQIEAALSALRNGGAL